jgi:hypothetical protein
MAGAGQHRGEAFFSLRFVSLLLLGLFLGIRHATDADHIVAVATIVSRQRTMRGSMLIGAAWGVGHSLTVIVVGGAIILFGVVIPPWLGFSMEFAVALMLVLLGVLTLTGLGRGIPAPEPARATPRPTARARRLYPPPSHRPFPRNPHPQRRPHAFGPARPQLVGWVTPLPMATPVRRRAGARTRRFGQHCTLGRDHHTRPRLSRWPTCFCLASQRLLE